MFFNIQGFLSLHRGSIHSDSRGKDTMNNNACQSYKYMIFKLNDSWKKRMESYSYMISVFLTPHAANFYR